MQSSERILMCRPAGLRQYSCKGSSRCRDGRLMQSSNKDTQALHSPVEQCSSSQTSGWLQAEHEWLSAGSALGYCCTPCSQPVSMTSVESGALTI
jgi:hypothetical protein